MVEACRDFYNKMNVELSDISRLNSESLTQEQTAIFGQLSEKVKERYYGSGLMIPEKLAGKRVLDIGCGSGSLVFMLSKMVGPSGFVFGVDISDGLIDTAKAETEFHWKQWGYGQSNMEFKVGNAESLDELGLKPESFDLIVSNGVFCCVPDKDKAYAQVYTLLKTGGQFFLSDVYAEKDRPESCTDDVTFWCYGLTGALRWDKLNLMVEKAGFTTPYLTQAAPVGIEQEEAKIKLENCRFVCAGHRIFKLPKGAARGASRVEYTGNIPGFSDALKWDVDLTFKTGVGVDVDSDLATILSASYLSDSFNLTAITDSPTTKRNQNPFVELDKLQAEGRLPEVVYTL